jgi:hypothetical protein
VKPGNDGDRVTGFPDLLLCGESGLMFAELKAAAKAPRADQKGRHHWLREAGARVEVWSPPLA